MLFRSAADRGDATAQNNLGGLYHSGQGVPQNYPEAVKWYRRAADQDFPGAQYNLGMIYVNGLGVPQDYPEAVKWYRKAADQRFPGAQFNLGLMYGTGQGLARDFVQAHKWFSLAASQYPESDAEARDLAIRNRDLIAAEMTPAQIGEAEKLARDWKPTK